MAFFERNPARQNHSAVRSFPIAERLTHPASWNEKATRSDQGSPLLVLGLKLTASLPLKIEDFWKSGDSYYLEITIFRGKLAVRFREGK